MEKEEWKDGEEDGDDRVGPFRFLIHDSVPDHFPSLRPFLERPRSANMNARSHTPRRRRTLIVDVPCRCFHKGFYYPILAFVLTSNVFFPRIFTSK